MQIKRTLLRLVKSYKSDHYQSSLFYHHIMIHDNGRSFLIKINRVTETSFVYVDNKQLSKVSRLKELSTFGQYVTSHVFELEGVNYEVKITVQVKDIDVTMTNNKNYKKNINIS